MRIESVNESEITIKGEGENSQTIQLSQREDGTIDYRVYNQLGRWEYCGGSPNEDAFVLDKDCVKEVTENKNE